MTDSLKAGISDEEIMEIADRWFCTGENQHKSDGYYYRSLGTPTNVRGSDLIEFARALLNRSQSEAPGIARAQQVLREMHEVNKGQQVADPSLFAALALDTVVPAEQAEDSAMLDWLEREHFSLSAIKEPCGDDQFALWWQVTQGRKSISGHPLASPREAIRAAIGRNREAGGS